MNDELISVIVPVYNTEKYIKKCIESIINQTYSNLEIILIDDGTLDKSWQICDLYADKDKRIRVVHKKNEGLAETRNYGINIAKGKYFAFIDSDDYIEKNMIEVLYNNLIENNADISVCDFIQVDENKHMQYNEYSKKEFIVEGNPKFENLRNEYYLATTVQWNKLYKAEIFKDIRYPKGKTNEDEFVIAKELYNAKRISYILEPLYYYYQRTDSIMHTLNINRLDFLEGLEERIKFYKSLDMKKEELLTKEIKADKLIIYTVKFNIDDKSQKYKNDIKKINDDNKDLLKELLKESISTKKKIKIFLYLFARPLAILLLKIRFKEEITKL